MRRIYYVLIMGAVLGLWGCSGRAGGGRETRQEAEQETSVSRETEHVEEEDEMDDLTFMMTAYGFREEELLGIDLKRLIEDYGLRREAYTADEVREILELEADVYQDDGSTELFSILEEEGGTLKEGAEICRIGYYCNQGTLIRKLVFDLENQQFYVNNTDPQPLSKEQIRTLRELPSKWGIGKWDSYYEGEEEPSTGSLKWKLVFELEDGSCGVYGGYTKDMTHLPKTYQDVDRELNSVIKGRSH